MNGIGGLFKLRPGRRALAISGLVAVVLAGSLALAFGVPNDSRLLSLLSGHGWLTTTKPGEVVLANGETGQVDFRLAVGTTHDPLDVVQSGQDALLIDEKTGEAGSIDVGNLKVVDQRRMTTRSGSVGTAADAGAANQVLPGPDGTFYIVHRDSGRIAVSDPVSGRTVASGTIGRGLSQAVVGGNGTLWTERESSGAMIGVDYRDGSLHVQEAQSSVVAPRDDVRLSSVNGTPAVLDQSRGLFFLAPDGAPGPAVSLPRTVARQAAVAPTLSGPVVPLAATGKVVLIEHHVGKVVDLNGRASDRLGAPIPFGGRVYVPDLTDGSVVVLNDDGDQVGSPIQVAPSSAPLQVDVQNGALFINDPDSGAAYSVTPAGQVNPISKNDPNVPTNHVTPTTVPSPVTLPPLTPPPVTVPTTVTPKPGTGAGSGGSGAGSKAPAGTTTTTTPAVAASVPAAPGSPTAQAGAGSATVSWTAPATHGSPITGYTVTWKSGGGGSTTVPASRTSVAITGLKNGTSYTFSVRAANAIGTGPSAQTTSVTPTNTVPDAPTNVAATANKDGSITVTWSKATGEGHQITGYTVTATPTSGAALAPVTATGTSTTFSAAQGIALGTSYTFTVTATNDAGGSSKPSNPSKAVTAATLPSSVGDLAVAPGDGSATVTWVCDPSDPSCSGGSPVTSFDLSVSPTPGTPPGSVAAVAGTSNYSQKIGNLTNGTPYTVTVAACNTLGCTATKVTASTVPFGAPAAPAVTGSVNGTTVNWSWNTPTGNGTAVTGFTISVNGSEVASGLVDSYSGTYGYAATETISVVAVNAGGVSGATGTNAQRTVTPPPPPPSITISRGSSTSLTGCTSACYWVDVSFSNFPANGSWDLICYQNGSQYFDSQTYGFTYKSNGSGSGTYDPSGSSGEGCAAGSGTVYVSLNGVTSNSIAM